MPDGVVSESYHDREMRKRDARIAALEAMLVRMVEDAYADGATVARNVGAARKLLS